MKDWRRFVLAGVLVLGSAWMAQAQIPYTFQNGVGGYEGAAETYLQTGAADAVHGDEADWEWDGSDAGGLNYGLIKFDNLFGTETGQIPPNSTIISATLRLVVTNNGASGQIATMHELLIPFEEDFDMISFGDGFEPFAGTDYEEASINDIPAPAGGDILELDVTDSIKKDQTGTFHGWIFVPGGSDGVGIASSEAAANRPSLTVVVQGATPPSGIRTFSGGTFTVFAPLNVTLDITVPAGETQNVKIEETLPTGWTATNISNGGTFSNGVITWNLTGASGTTQLTYSAMAGASPTNTVAFNGLVNDTYVLTGTSTVSLLPLESIPPFYKTKNVLAVGVWNSDNGSSDLAVTAEVVDSNGTIYVQDTSADGGWPAGTTFKYMVVFYADGSGEEEEGWQQRDFDDTDWNTETEVGFTVGHGSDEENGEILLIPEEESVYTRSIFDAQNYETIKEITIKLAGDDEAVAWFNGIFVGYTASGTSDRGETAKDYVFDTTISGGQGGLEDTGNPTNYVGSGTKIFTFPVNLVDAPPTSLVEWALY